MAGAGIGFFAGNEYGPVKLKLLKSLATVTSPQFSTCDKDISGLNGLPTATLVFTASSATTAAVCFGFDYSPSLNIVSAFLGAGVQYSTNYGVTWTTGVATGITTPYSTQWHSGLGLFIGSSQDVTTGSMSCWISTDGMTYTRAGQTTLSASSFNNAYSPTLDIVLLPGCATTANSIFWATASTLSSTTKWTAGTITTSSCAPRKVTWLTKTNKFIVSGDLTGTTVAYNTSTDGKTWTLNTSPSGFTALANNSIVIAFAEAPNLGTGSGRIVAIQFTGSIGTKPIAYSDNGGSTWTMVTLAAGTYGLWSIQWVEQVQMFIVTGTNANNLLMSKDGINWTKYTGPSGSRAQCVILDPVNYPQWQK